MAATTPRGTGLLERHVAFVEALRRAGLPVSLAEDLDAVRAVGALPLADREAVRSGYAATLVKRPSHRLAFDTVFDLYFPALIGDGEPGEEIVPDVRADESDESRSDRRGLSPHGDGPEDLADFRERLADALATTDQTQREALLAALAREAIGRFGPMRGRAPGLSTWSAYTTLHRVDAQRLLDQLVEGLVAEAGDDAPDPGFVRRRVQRRVDRFTALAEADARRRIAETRGFDDGPQTMAEHAVRPPIELLDFSAARRGDLEDMRRQVQPLARKLATRLTRERAARRRGALDFRRTVRASMSTGGVPVETRHKPKRPGRTDLVVLCDVSGSVANFAQFTLMLVYALRAQFAGVRAFTFVDDVTEVTQHFRPGADPEAVLADLAASVQQAALFGRTNYGRAFGRFEERFPGVLNPRSSLIVLGDARSNFSDLALPTLRRLAHDARHAWWLNPEHPRHWDTGDSAASAYGEVVPMVECRNLVQLEAFVRELAG